MTSEFLPMAPPATPAQAQYLLDDLMARVGVDGLTAALAQPGLMAQIDQHAAAVSESLALAGRELDATGLANYARSVLAGALRMGRPIPEAGEAVAPHLDWARAPWHLMRLVAVCALADERALWSTVDEDEAAFLVRLEPVAGDARTDSGD